MSTRERAFTIDRVRSDTPVATQLLGEYFEGLRARLPEFDPSQSVSAEPEEMTAPRGAFLVVRAGDRALACGGLKTHAPAVGEIKRMYVRPEARRRGVARALLEALEDEARALGMTSVVLDTRVPEAAEAVELYRSAGYVDVPPYNDNRFANVWMRKPLPDRADAGVVRGFEDTTLPASAFGHREHVLVAWTYVRALPFDEACARFLEALRRYVTAHGATSKYDEALSLGYLRAIADAVRATAASTGATPFDAFAAAHPDLLAKRRSPA